MTARIDVLVVHSRHTSRAGEHGRSGGVIRELPEFLARGEVQAAKLVTHCIITVEEIDLTPENNRPAVRTPLLKTSWNSGVFSKRTRLGNAKPELPA